MAATDSGRIPLVIVEIDQDQCSLDYGTSPCQAAIGVTGSAKCYKTRVTCQDPDNYTAGSVTLTYCKANSHIPKDRHAVPSLVGVTSTSSRVNIAMADQNAGPLGNRSVATVTLQDHADSDRLTDPYVDDRDYDPLTRGTYWSKWLTRNPYYIGRPLRIREGYVGQSISAMQTRYYLIDRISGPDSRGTVTITAKDPLKLADGDRAKAPRRSTGLLTEDVTASQTTITVSGASTADYPATGTVRIGDEVMTYASRAADSGGGVTFSGLTRGTDGTTADTHGQGDTVQVCLRYTSADPWAVAYELLTDYAEVPASYIDYSAWQATGAEYLSSYQVSALITEPTDVNQLVGELARDTLSYYWWDDRNQLVQLTAMRPAAPSDYQLNEQDHIVAGSFVRGFEVEQRVNQIWLSYLPVSAISDREKPTGYRTTRVKIDTDASSADQYGDTRIMEINSRWITSAAHAIQVNTILMTRFRDPPEKVKFQLDAKDRAVGIGDIISVRHPSIVDATGQSVYHRFEVIAAREVEAGHLVEIEAISFVSLGRVAGWAEETAPDYISATEAEKDTNAYWSNEAGLMPDGTPGYNWQ